MNAFGNTTSIKAGDSTLVTYTYNQNNGKLLQVEYGTGKTVNYTYDSLDRVKEICYNDGTEEEYSDLYTYTADGAVQSVESTGSGRRYDYLYNLKGQVIEMTECEKDENGNYVPLMGHLYQYDDLDRPYMQQSIFQYAVGTATADGDVAYDYYYEDYEGVTPGVPHVGELTALEISGAGYTDDVTITYGYDALYRLTTKTLALPSTDFFLEAEYGYTDTTRVNSYTSTAYIGEEKDEIVSSSSYSYAYNNSGNIVRIVDGNDEAIVYQYDDVGQLVRENNEPLGETYVYTYDNAGNRTSKTTYAYTIDSVNDLTPTETIEYGYGTGDWGDQLVLIKTNNLITDIFSYDVVGNPTIYSGYTMTWDGRRLMRMQKSSADISFTYNSDGIRTRKTVNGVDHIYTLEGSRIVSESWGDNLLIYLYDESGAPIGMQYRNTTYAANRFDTFYFEKNLQGDVVAVYNSSGIKVISYTYDAWGNHTVTWHDSYSTNFNAYYNPFRYRGYYYDTETGLYYLQSRYYNPQWGRFLNADSALYNNTLGYNIYLYCNNNPVNYCDPTGENGEAATIGWFASMWWLMLADGPIPAGDIIYFVGGLLICAVVAVGPMVLSQKSDIIANVNITVNDDDNPLPDESEVDVDMPHILDRHSPGNGKFPKKDKFPYELTAPIIERIIREAYENARANYPESVINIQQKLPSILNYHLEGFSGETRILLWFDAIKKIITTAFPK